MRKGPPHGSMRPPLHNRPMGDRSISNTVPSKGPMDFIRLLQYDTECPQRSIPIHRHRSLFRKRMSGPNASRKPRSYWPETCFHRVACVTCYYVFIVVLRGNVWEDGGII